ncbi:polysaccharide deacetylase family protein [Parachitinimonas caeni]|uniref:Polysaccharide deacetylase n=1 Tax=Parachitinimonas caeni TaxID=3031301 RepID=A0ABT7DS58_9NEIS|nr:hypothetical protein [Parachitinimonas caeni]MDK2122895.1 hypothetical protein [Parachitinimonas caeni]
MPANDFTLPGYGQLLAALFAKGYSVARYAEVVPDQPQLILRHDVDMDLERALQMAEFEARIGVRASYYVLLRTEMYNLFSDRGSRIIQQLGALGHEVGLHFDASLYAPERTVLESAAEQECQMLQSILGRAVDTITFHRPAPALQGMPGRFAGRLHGYDPRFFSDIGYCSDSEGRWRFGHPLEHEAIDQGRALQLVTHPVWWCAYAGEPVITKLQRLLQDKADQLRNEVAINCKPYKAHLKAQVEQLL